MAPQLQWEKTETHVIDCIFGTDGVKCTHVTPSPASGKSVQSLRSLRLAGRAEGEKSTRPGASSRGTNQTGVRLYNERLVLSLIRLHGQLPKVDIAKMTGLSPQTISIIMNQLSADGLLLKGSPSRGRIGQP